MVLSANAITEEDIVEGLNAGADEYLVKPIRLNEFVARVHALLRRRSRQAKRYPATTTAISASIYCG